MNITQENIWATPIWFTDIPFDIINPNEILEDCYTFKKNNAGADLPQYKAWTSNNIISNIPQNTKKLINTIEEICNSTAIHYNAKNLNPKCLDAWYHINYSGGFINPHIHRHGPFSAVYYLKAPINSGNLYFINTSSSTHFNKVYLNNEGINNAEMIQYETKPGRLIIFPSWLIHTSPLNLSDEDRVSFGIDLG
jgi:uncharacterized protein (TIGR02466 family)